MADLSRLKKRILGDAAAAAEKIIAEARTAAAEITADAGNRAAANKEQILAVAAIEAEEATKRIQSIYALNRRKMILTAKRACIDEVFRKTIEKINRLPADEYFAALASLALPELKTGNEEILLSSVDFKRMPADFKTALDTKTGGDIRIKNGGTAVKSGFIIKKGDVEINGTFESALSMKRDSLEPDVSGILFND